MSKVDPRNTTLLCIARILHDSGTVCFVLCTVFSWIFETELLIIERREKQLGLSKRELVTFGRTIFHYCCWSLQGFLESWPLLVPQSLMYVKHHEILPNAFWSGGLYPVEYYFRRYIDRFLETTTAMTNSHSSTKT